MPINMEGGSGTDIFTLEIYSDPGGKTDGVGSLLGSWDAHASQTPRFSPIAPIFEAATGVNLVAGDFYWIGAVQKRPGGELDWYMNSTGATNNILVNYKPYGDGSAQPLPAFAVELQPYATPEPAGVLPLLAGVAMLVRRRR
jgi:hypothetical protein